MRAHQGRSRTCNNAFCLYPFKFIKSSHSPQTPEAVLYAKETRRLSTKIRKLEREFSSLVGISPPAFARHLYLQWQSVKFPRSELLAASTEVLDDLLSSVVKVQADILLVTCTLGPGWQEAEDLRLRLTETIRYAEDVLCFALQGTAELKEAHKKKKLLYQQVS